MCLLVNSKIFCISVEKVGALAHEKLREKWAEANLGQQIFF